MIGAVVSETIARHLRSLPYAAFVLVIAIMGGVAAYLGADAGLWLGFFTILYLVAGCQLIGPEFSSGTLQLILVKPVNRTAYVASRVAGVVLAIWMAMAVVFLTDLAVRLMKPDPAFLWSRHFAVVSTSALAGALTCALLGLFGSFTRSYVNVAIYFVIQIVLSLLRGMVEAIGSGSIDSVPSLTAFVRAHPGIGESFRNALRNLYPRAAEQLDWRFIMMMVSNTLVAVTIAALVFKRREVPYGAD